MNIWQKIRLFKEAAKNKKPLNLGAQAEQYALDYLLKQGLTLRERNVRCKKGEIDLIMSEGETLVFVEVRLRSRTAYASASESIGTQKQAKLIQTARYYIQQRYGDSEPICRFDVIALESFLPVLSDKNKFAYAHSSPLGPSSEKCSLEWIKNAFEVERAY